MVCFSIELNELQMSRCLKHFHRGVKTTKDLGESRLINDPGEKIFLSRELIPLLVVGVTE